MEMTQTLKDAAYIAVGLGVIGFQRAQVARHDLTRSLGTDQGKLQEQVRGHVEDVTSAVEAQLADVRTQVTRAVTTLEDTLEPLAKDIEERLPEQVKAVVANAREAAGSAATQVRSILAA